MCYLILGEASAAAVRAGEAAGDRAGFKASPTCSYGSFLRKFLHTFHQKQQELQRQQLEGKAVIPPPDASASASSLLGRARAAEELVRSLRRQLDTVVSAAAAANNGDPVHVAASNDSSAVAATAVVGTTLAPQISDPMTARGAAGPPTSRPTLVVAQGAQPRFNSYF